MIQFIKKYKVVYFVFFYSFSLLFRIVGAFIKTKSNRILFISFGGKRFDDSPRVIYEAMLDNQCFNEIEYIWAFTDPTQFEISKGVKVRIDTFKYFYYALSSKIWVVNSSAERGLSFKKKATICFNTWHGTPLKRMGSDMHRQRGFTTLSKYTDDIFLVQGEFEAKIFTSAFNVKESAIRRIGLPRNDIYVHITDDNVSRIKLTLQIPQSKKIILYMPTFRDYDTDEFGKKVFNPPIDLEKWNKLLGGEYIVLYRLHYEVDRTNLSGYNGSFAHDMSNYPLLSDLIIISDILISDYSSVFFDYSITHKPMLCFAYDFEMYAKERGLYLDLVKDMPSGCFYNEDDLLNQIKSNLDENKREVVVFKEKFVPYSGNATKQAIDIIKELFLGIK